MDNEDSAAVTAVLFAVFVGIVLIDVFGLFILSIKAWKFSSRTVYVPIDYHQTDMCQKSILYYSF